MAAIFVLNAAAQTLNIALVCSCVPTSVGGRSVTSSLFLVRMDPETSSDMTETLISSSNITSILIGYFGTCIEQTFRNSTFPMQIKQTLCASSIGNKPPVMLLDDMLSHPQRDVPLYEVPMDMLTSMNQLQSKLLKAFPIGSSICLCVSFLFMLRHSTGTYRKNKREAQSAYTNDKRMWICAAIRWPAYLCIMFGILSALSLWYIGGTLEWVGRGIPPPYVIRAGQPAIAMAWSAFALQIVYAMACWPIYF